MTEDELENEEEDEACFRFEIPTPGARFSQERFRHLVAMAKKRVAETPMDPASQ